MSYVKAGGCEFLIYFSLVDGVTVRARGSFIHIQQKYSGTVEESFPTSLTPLLKEGHGITPPTSQVLTNYT